MTNQDTLYNARLGSKGMAAATFYGSGQTAYGSYTPSASQINLGLMGDIGRAIVTSLEFNDNPFSFAFQSELSRGDAVLNGRFKGVNSRQYDPKAADSVLFNANMPDFVASVAQKNFSRQADIEINDRMLKQYMQTAEMLGDVEAALMASLNVCLNQDLYAASVEYFGGSTRGAKSTQSVQLTNKVGDAGFGAELVETIWDITQRKMAYVSDDFNKSGIETKANEAVVIMDKRVQYPAFKKLYADTFNPEFLDLAINGKAKYVESWPTTAGAPSNTELVAIITDPRAFQITGLPQSVSVESFRNPARKSTSFFETAEFIFGHAPMYDCMYVFAPTQ